MPTSPAAPSRQVWLIGMPVKHSLSPTFQNAGFQAQGLGDWRYLLKPTPPNTLAHVFDAVRSGVAIGANVTVPYKGEACAAVDKLDPDAARVGAVNTLVSDNGVLCGYNTDVYGFRRMLEEWRAQSTLPAFKTALVLGAGGASRAVLIALQQLGVERIVFANRTPSRAEAVGAALQSVLGDIKIDAVGLDAIASQPVPELIVQCTSLGIGTEPGSKPFQDAVAVWEYLPWSAWPNAAVVDICYSPTQTPMVALAKRLGLRAIDGLDMLLYQGTQAFELWTGQPAPVAAMRQALYAAVRR